MQKAKVGINKVKFRLLELWPPSVKQGFENECQISDFENLVKVGEGSFGIVFKGTYKKTGATYAIKAIDKRNKTNQEGRSYFKREIEIMYKIRHPNIVRLYTHFEDDSYCYFVMEFVAKGNLFDNIEKQRKKCFDMKTVALLMKDLASAVYYLHSMDPPIIHRDIKLENVLLNDDGVLKLTDFGWSNYIMDDEVRDTFCGTPVYLAPEMVKRKEHDHNVDIWCIGVMMFELLTGKLPFNTTSKLALEDSIMKVKINWPTDINNQARDLISRILKFTPSDRLQIENMFKHPFFTSQITNPSEALIKPNTQDELDIYLMNEHTPNMIKPKVTNILPTEIQSTTPNNNKDVETLKLQYEEANKKLKVLLEKEQKEKKDISNRLIEVTTERDNLILEVKQLNEELNLLKQKTYDLSQSVVSLENQGKIDLSSLEKTNQKLLDEIEILNERIELHKNYYKEHLEKFDAQMQINMDDNQKNIESTAVNIRESLSNFNTTSSNSSEIEQLKKSFEEEISKLKKIMTKERENYNIVLESNMKELMKLNEEKNKIKENSNKYYEKLICKYDLKLKQKEAEIEELKKQKK